MMAPSSVFSKRMETLFFSPAHTWKLWSVWAFMVLWAISYLGLILHTDIGLICYKECRNIPLFPNVRMQPPSSPIHHHHRLIRTGGKLLQLMYPSQWVIYAPITGDLAGQANWALPTNSLQTYHNIRPVLLTLLLHTTDFHPLLRYNFVLYYHQSRVEGRLRD